MELIGDAPRTKDLERIGIMLQKLVRRKKPFTAGYFYNIISGEQNLGAPLARALRAYWMSQNGVRPPIAGAYENIAARAIPGTVETGSYILGDSKRCANRRCMHPFVPVVPWQKYCSEACRKEEADAVKRDEMQMRTLDSVHSDDKR